jgi:uncharacterized protein YceK
MNLHEQARAEAEKRFPERFVKDGPLADYYDENAGYRGVYAAGFLAGHEAATRTRVVTTVAELDALPVGSVVLDRLLMPWHKRPGTRWYSTGWDGGVRSPAIALPARVLHDPEDAYADAARIAGEGR